jgi:hypothetical protein
MSNINPQSIDGTYPIAGQDNNSQGFRDNFTNTINNFTFAAAELTDLQQKAVLKAPLGSVGQTGTPTNDMNYAFLTHAQLIGTVETKDNIGTISSGSNFEVDWETGHFQTVSITTTAGMTFTNWPSSTSVWSRLRLQITATTLSNLTISGTYIENLQNIQGASGNVLTLNTGVYQFDFSSLDAGAHAWIEDVTRNYTVNGATALAGSIVTTGLQQFYPTANVAITGNIGISRILVTPTTSPAIVSLFVDVTLPNVTTDGTVLSISSNVAVNQLRTLSPWVGTTVSPSANVSLTAGSNAEYLYRSAESKWYKVG